MVREYFQDMWLGFRGFGDEVVEFVSVIFEEDDFAVGEIANGVDEVGGIVGVDFSVVGI